MIKSAIFDPNLLFMIPKSLLLFISFFILSLSISAQYTEKINTNRPGTSQGAFAVGNNVLQIEGGLGFGKEKHKILNTKTTLFNIDYAIRYGLLWEQLELRLNGSFRADVVKRNFGGTEEKTNRSNFKVNTIGAKYLFFDPYKRPKKDSINLNSWKAQHKFKWKSLIPAMSIYVGANFISKDNPFTFPGDASISPRIVFATQNNWQSQIVGNWVLVTNIFIDKISTDDPVIGGLITSTHTLNDQWAIFGELENQKSNFYSDNIMRLGGAYLWDKNLQLDANLAFNFKDTPSVFVFSFGAAYRLDWHKKDEIIEKPGFEGGIKEELENDGSEDGEGDEENDDLEEYNDPENDSLKYTKTPLINDFEDDDFREDLERDLDERRTDERLERERVMNEKLSKKEGKKRRKEEKRRVKFEEKEAKAAEKARIKAEKDKQKMIDDIDAELDQMDQEKGNDKELDALDEELKKLEDEEEKEEEKEEKETQEDEDDIDAEYDRYQEEQERTRKAEEKARKAEEKRSRKEEKKRLKEEKKREKELEKNNG